MKKLLGLLGACGLIAGGSAQAVACGEPAKEEPAVTPPTKPEETKPPVEPEKPEETKPPVKPEEERLNLAGLVLKASMTYENVLDTLSKVLKTNYPNVEIILKVEVTNADKEEVKFEKGFVAWFAYNFKFTTDSKDNGVILTESTYKIIDSRRELLKKYFDKETYGYVNYNVEDIIGIIQSHNQILKQNIDYKITVINGKGQEILSQGYLFKVNDKIIISAIEEKSMILSGKVDFTIIDGRTNFLTLKFADILVNKNNKDVQTIFKNAGIADLPGNDYTVTIKRANQTINFDDKYITAKDDLITLKAKNDSKIYRGEIALKVVDKQL